jgi:GGDEF domain-containing protein
MLLRLLYDIALKFTASMGIALVTEKDHDLTGFLRRAVVALYRAKHNNKNPYRFFDDPIS